MKYTFWYKNPTKSTPTSRISELHTLATVRSMSLLPTLAILDWEDLYWSSKTTNPNINNLCSEEASSIFRDCYRQVEGRRSTRYSSDLLLSLLQHHRSPVGSSLWILHRSHSIANSLRVIIHKFDLLLACRSHENLKYIPYGLASDLRRPTGSFFCFVSGDSLLSVMECQPVQARLPQS